MKKDKREKKSLRTLENEKLVKAGHLKEVKIKDRKGGFTKILVMSIVAACATGCMGGVYMGTHDYVEFGSEAGMRSKSEHDIGLVNEAKTTPDTTGAHYKLMQDKEVTERIKSTKKNWLETWLSRPAGSGVEK